MASDRDALSSLALTWTASFHEGNFLVDIAERKLLHALQSFCNVAFYQMRNKSGSLGRFQRTLDQLLKNPQRMGGILDTPGVPGIASLAADAVVTRYMVMVKILNASTSSDAVSALRQSVMEHMLRRTIRGVVQSLFLDPTIFDFDAKQRPGGGGGNHTPSSQVNKWSRLQNIIETSMQSEILAALPSITDILAQRGMTLPSASKAESAAASAAATGRFVVGKSSRMNHFRGGRQQRTQNQSRNRRSVSPTPSVQSVQSNQSLQSLQSLGSLSMQSDLSIPTGE